jgi:putative mRNA 3-end processing factor
MSHLLEFTRKGIYCPQADIYIDPSHRVANAIITHAHGDHARPGSKHYLAHKHSEPILRMRLGEQISLRTVEYGEEFIIQGVKFSLHPAGHIIGSAQVRVEYKGEVWVVSGDYKLQNDNFCTPFEPVKCDVFISETTFGLSKFKWQPQHTVMDEITKWVLDNRNNGITSVLMGYALGKMQRLLVNLPEFDFPVYAHPTIVKLHERLKEAGHKLPAALPLKHSLSAKTLNGALVLSQPSATDNLWLRKLPDYQVGFCSGWVGAFEKKKRTNYQRGFELSDHADWEELNTAVKETGAQRIYTTHGYTSEFSKWLRVCGLQSMEWEKMHDSGAVQMVMSMPEQNDI